MEYSVIPEERHWEFRECFAWFDKDGDGYISSSDLPAALRTLGQYYTLYEFKELMGEFTSNKQLNYREFMKICERKYGIVPDQKAMERAFELFDRTESGFVLLEDVRHVLCNVGEKITHEEFAELCGIHGIQYEGGSQKIDKPTFLKIFSVTDLSSRPYTQP